MDARRRVVAAATVGKGVHQPKHAAAAKEPKGAGRQIPVAATAPKAVRQAVLVATKEPKHAGQEVLGAAREPKRAPRRGAAEG